MLDTQDFFHRSSTEPLASSEIRNRIVFFIMRFIVPTFVTSHLAPNTKSLSVSRPTFALTRLKPFVASGRLQRRTDFCMSFTSLPAFGTPKFGITRTLPGVAFEKAVENVRAALKNVGFGVITEIDMQATSKCSRNRGSINSHRFLLEVVCHPFYCCLTWVCFFITNRTSSPSSEKQDR